MWKQAIRKTILQETDSIKKGWNVILSDNDSWSSEEDLLMETGPKKSSKTSPKTSEEDSITETKTKKKKKKMSKQEKKMTNKSKTMSPSLKVQHELERWKMKGKRRAKRSEKMSLSHRLESHTPPSEDIKCLSCGENLTTLNYIEYCEYGKRSWRSSKSCESCVRRRLKTQWYEFNAKLESTRCARVRSSAFFI